MRENNWKTNGFLDGYRRQASRRVYGAILRRVRRRGILHRVSIQTTRRGARTGI